MDLYLFKSIPSKYLNYCDDQFKIKDCVTLVKVFKNLGVFMVFPQVL